MYFSRFCGDSSSGTPGGLLWLKTLAILCSFGTPLISRSVLLPERDRHWRWPPPRSWWGRNHSPHIRPFEKPGEYSAVELTWGAVNKTLMETWIHIVAPGYPFRRTVFITHMDRGNNPKRLIQLNGAWPKEWKVGDMDASGNEIATESLTLVCEFVSVIGL